jgi:hypothetical protein
MKHAHTPLMRVTAGAIMVAVLAAPAQLPASAQEATTTTTSTATAKKFPRTTATPEMIVDAIERSKSRTERARTLGIPERFGSEDPTRFSVTK